MIMERVDLKLKDRICPLLVETGSISKLPEILAQRQAPAQIMAVIDANIAGTHGALAIRELRKHGSEPAVQHVHADEHHKSLDAARELYQAMLQAKCGRDSMVIAIGGGIVTDLAGFVAATYMRGVELALIPSTLLGMVDASIGGKTGVNILNAEGLLLKNMAGSFWQPSFVLIDPMLLRTLPPREFRCGLAECVKHGMIADPALIRFMAVNAEQIMMLDMPVLTTLITESVRIKARIVEEDERECGRRALLNLGHTFAHAIEAVAADDIKHGEAVAIGLVAAMSCAAKRGRFAAAEHETITNLLERFQLPLRLPKPLDASKLSRAILSDKKAAQKKVRLVLPDGIGAASVIDDADDAEILRAWGAVGARINA
jgi:3-dehydroquinate synthase